VTFHFNSIHLLQEFLLAGPLVQANMYIGMEAVALGVVIHGIGGLIIIKQQLKIPFIYVDILAHQTNFFIGIHLVRLIVLIRSLQQATGAVVFAAIYVQNINTSIGMDPVSIPVPIH